MKKDSRILLIVIAIAIDIAGKYAAICLNLPLWLDSFGTVLAAYAVGPAGGAVAGLACSALFGVYNHKAFFYSLVNALMGAVVGFSARKKRFDSLFGTMSVSGLLTFLSVVLSTPLNAILRDGMTGNMWGDGVIEYLQRVGLHKVVRCPVGEFYIDFLDRLLTLLSLFLCIKIVRNIRARRKKKAGSSGENVSAAGKKLLCIGCVSLLFLLVFSVPCRMEAFQTQDNDKKEYISYVQTVYSSENGLACGTANDVVQTEDGILWVGTYAGLYRYSGREFQMMSNYNSVKNVNCLYVDHSGRLWIGTNDNGLAICSDEEMICELNMQGGLLSDTVRSIVENEADGYYYVGTADALQVLKMDGELQIVKSIPEIVYADILTTDQNGNVAAVTLAGELFVIRDGEIISRGTLEKGQDIYTCCMFGKDGLLYAGDSGNNVYAYQLTGNHRKLRRKFPCEGLNKINSIYFSEDGQMFVCADNGIGHFAVNRSYTKLNTNQFNNSIDHMTMDFQGNLWFTSSRLGLLRMTRSSFLDMYGIVGMESRVVNTVERWQNLLYIGTDTGLDIIDPSSGTQLQDALTEELRDVRIRCIRVDSKDHLWLCTYGRGLVEVSPDGRLTSYDSADGIPCDRSRVVTELSDGTIAAAGDVGLTFIENGQEKKTLLYDHSWCGARILCLLEQEDGTLLAGTDGDGIAVVKDGEPNRKIERADGLSSGVVLRIVEASGDAGYFIVTSNGLSFMDHEYHIRMLDNFPYFNNYDVCIGPHGRLFVLSSAGIYVVNEQALLSGEGELEYELLDVKRGLRAALTANAWNYKDTDGNLYLSCDQGVYAVNMQNYGSMQKTYRMKVAEIAMDDVTQQVDGEYTFYISRDTRKIRIYPEIVNYTVEDPHVSFQLEGYEAKETVVSWSKLNSIVYSNIPVGRYVFRLAVLDNEGNTLVENNHVLFKEAEIYDHWWFKLYMVCVASLAISWFTWFLVRTQLQRTLSLQRRELELARKQVQMGDETILAIAKTVDAKDKNTSRHSQRVSEYSVLIARELGFDRNECENLRKAALLHDIGKIGIPDRILNKPHPLTDEEYAVMKTHVTRGAEILKDFTSVEHVVDGALYHHERYDGKGYMHGLKGEEIPIYGRIIGVADAFDAMTQNRVYRNKLSLDFVIGELERCKGTQFDPQITDIMLRLVREGVIDLHTEGEGQ